MSYRLEQIEKQTSNVNWKLKKARNNKVNVLFTLFLTVSLPLLLLFSLLSIIIGVGLHSVVVKSIHFNFVQFGVGFKANVNDP